MLDPEVDQALMYAGWARAEPKSGRTGVLKRFVSFAPPGVEPEPVRLPTPDDADRRLLDALAAFDVRLLSALTDPLDLVEPLERAVSSAMYWEPPDDEDRALRERALLPALQRIGAALQASRAAEWWGTGIDLTAQRSSDQWSEGHRAGAPELAGTASALERWLAVEREGEASAAIRSGHWWSAPTSAVPITTRALIGGGCTELVLKEDSFGPDQAELHPVAPIRPVRVLEIDGPQGWVDLVAAHPLDVTRSRLHVWNATTGLTGPWSIPDWAAVAAQWDAVHLTVFGYLTTATRALRVGDAFTVLAGWSPDETLWLGDVLQATGEVERWTRPDERWERIA